MSAMMSLFDGVHEVRLIRPSGVAVGYFDSFEAALRAIENEPSQYRAAYFTLNPIKVPEGLPVNPQSLTPSRNAAGASDMSRRVWLLVDLDPPRPAGTSSTDREKQAAYEQAAKVREYLDSRSWPKPMLCDSGNGWHLQYRIELQNDESATALVRGVLARLHQLFPMVDAGNFDAPRLCKLYGSWARKGTHTEDRPWRRSAIIEGGDIVAVTEEQLRALSPTPLAMQAPSKVHDDVKLSSLLGFLDYYGVVQRSEPRETTGGWQIEVECPWIDEHTSEGNRDTVVSFIAGLGNGFKCFHSHCVARNWRSLRAELEKRNPGLAPFFGKLPAMNHSDIARDFVATHDDFVTVYDMKNETAVWLPGIRWRLSDPRDINLRKAIRRHLDELFDKYPKPDGRDARPKLKDASFSLGVLNELRPLLPAKSMNDFDIDRAILPLPYGKIADLRTGTIREMRREDCQTRRLKIAPTATATPRWDRFLREITCDDGELASYVERLMATALTGLSMHQLIFFYGSGRNGKGVLLRLLSKILRGETFVVNIRPEELEFRRGGEEKAKRLFGRLKGARLAFTSETVSGGLDWTLLKLLTGGDALAGAKLYADDSSFEPSHTLILTTNDRPILPATAAFKGRLRFVPFRADFSGREDLRLEDALAEEAPGILWRLIKLAPSVFDGDNPPAAVVEATDDVMDENDAARPFIEECLEADPHAVTRVEDMQSAIDRWVGLKVGGTDARRVMEGVKAKWPHGRLRVGPVKVRGFVGVKLLSP